MCNVINTNKSFPLVNSNSKSTKKIVNQRQFQRKKLLTVKHYILTPLLLFISGFLSIYLYFCKNLMFNSGLIECFLIQIWMTTFYYFDRVTSPGQFGLMLRGQFDRFFQSYSAANIINKNA